MILIYTVARLNLYEIASSHELCNQSSVKPARSREESPRILSLPSTQREKQALLSDNTLAHAAQKELEKLLQGSRQRLFRHLVDYKVCQSTERIVRERYSLVTRRIESPVRCSGDGERFDCCVEVGHARVSQAVGVCCHRAYNREHFYSGGPMEIRSPLASATCSNGTKVLKLRWRPQNCKCSSLSHLCGMASSFQILYPDVQVHDLVDYTRRSLEGVVTGNTGRGFRQTFCR